MTELCKVEPARVSGDIIEIDPLLDTRWNEFVRKHPAASVFQTGPWLETLRRTYGYEVSALTTSDSQGNIVSAVPFCHVNSWMTGRRIVALPFSDHCDPLVADSEELSLLVAALEQRAILEGCRYVELRPRSSLSDSVFGLQESHRYCLHRLDLRPGASEVFAGFHRDCIQRKIRRAQREKLVVDEGTTSAILAQFYELVVRTRRRQGLPPQPLAWFRNLIECLGPSASIRIANKNGQPLAGILTIKNNQCLTYKYGASDERYHSLGGMIYLFWIAIEDAINNGFVEFDMGRSEIDNAGLLAFKDRWGASRSRLSYWRCALHNPSFYSSSWAPKLLKKVSRHCPDRVLVSLGTRWYRHIG